MTTRLLTRAPSTDTAYGKPVDVWAVGCLLAEVASGQPLFPGDSDVDQLCLIMRCLGPLGPRMADVARRNPLLAGVVLPDVPNPETLPTRLAGMGVTEARLVDAIVRCLRYEPLQRCTAG